MFKCTDCWQAVLIIRSRHSGLVFWTAAEPRGRRREHIGVLPHFVIAVVYVCILTVWWWGWWGQSCCPGGLALASRILEDTYEGLGLGLGLGLERKVLALALARPTLFPQDPASWLLYVYALLTLMVSHDSLPFLAEECFTDLHVN